MKKRVLVVGLGSIGRRHARLLAEREELVVEWCEVNGEMVDIAAEELGNPNRVFGDFSEGIASGPDFVVIATPQSMHCSQAVEALRAGIPVLCEKPLSDNLEDAREIVRCVDETGVCFAIGFQSHFSEGHLRLRHAVQSGQIGRVRHFHCRVGTYQTLQNSRSRYQTQSVGALIQDYAHQPDLAQWILGEVPEEVIARGVTSRVPELWAEPNVLSVDTLYADALIGTLHLNYLQSPQRHHYEIVGDEGWVFFDADTGHFETADRRANCISRVTCCVERDPVYRVEHEAFFSAAAGDRFPESPAADGLISVAVADAAIESWQTGLSIRLPELLPPNQPALGMPL